MKKTLYILLAIALLISCRDNGAYRTLQSAEQLLETDVVAADSILESMTPPSSKRGQAWFAVLKTQADYKQYKPIYKTEIEKLEKMIEKEVNRRDKIENGNYILAMELKEIRDGNLKTVEDIAKWCFEMIKTGKMIKQITDKE